MSFSVFEKIRHVCGHSLLEVVKRRATDREESFKRCLNVLLTGSLWIFFRDFSFLLEVNGQHGCLKKLQPELADLDWGNCSHVA